MRKRRKGGFSLQSLFFYAPFLQAVMLSQQNSLTHVSPPGPVVLTEGSCVNAIDPDGMCGERTGEAMLNSERS
jgi:hypothetical protein